MIRIEAGHSMDIAYHTDTKCQPHCGTLAIYNTKLQRVGMYSVTECTKCICR